MVLIASQDIGMSPFLILDTSFAQMGVFISVKFMSKAGELGKEVALERPEIPEHPSQPVPPHIPLHVVIPPPPRHSFLV